MSMANSFHYAHVTCTPRILQASIFKIALESIVALCLTDSYMLLYEIHYSETISYAQTWQGS